MNNTALLIIDVQEALIAEQPYHEKELLENINTLLAAARKNSIEVIYVRHNGGAGDELEPFTKGWYIYSSILPEAGERVFDKRYNSAFKDTGLKEYLYIRGISNLILAGMQTEYCIDATCKAAFEYGFKLIVPEGATTTYDNDYLSGEKLVKFYERVIWNRRFAEVIPMNQVIKLMETA